MAETIDLRAGEGRGPLVGLATEDLNLTVLAWPPGEGVAEHVNEERDVAYVVVQGSADFTVDGVTEAAAAPAAIVVPKGTRRRVEAGPDGVRYVTVHRVRAGLTIGRPGSPPPP